MTTRILSAQSGANASRGVPGILRQPEVSLSLLFLALSVIVPGVLGDSYWQHIFLLLNLFFIVAVCQNFLLADAGQVSFGQGAVFGIAAYVVGIACSLHDMGLFTGLALGTGAGLLLGAIFAFPALRVSGFYLGFVTLAAAMVMPEMLVYFSDYTNGINGISFYESRLLEPVVYDINLLSIVILVMSCGALVFHAWVRETKLGRRIRVAASSPEAAMTLGFSPNFVRSVAFFIAAFGSALAGSLYGPLVGFLSPDAFHFDLSIFFFFAVIIGGTGNVMGPMFGVLILYLIPNIVLVDLINYRMLGYGIVALLITLLFPDGVAGAISTFFARKRREPSAAGVSMDVMQRMISAEKEDRRGRTEITAEQAIQVRQLSRSFGSVKALDDVSVSIRTGTIHGIVGPNGSGKTTLLNALSGLIAIDRGDIVIMDRSVSALTPDAIARLGVARSFQTPRIFDALSIIENLQVGLDGRKVPSSRMDALFGELQGDWSQANPGSLPHAQRRSLEMLRCLTLSPDVLLLDEPAAGLTREERAHFSALLRQLRDELGLTIVLVEHDLNLVWNVADEITCMDNGRVVAQDTPENITQMSSVMNLFGGVVSHAAS